MTVQAANQDPILDLANTRLSAQKATLRTFYYDLWNKADTNVIPQVFHKDFTFRGSLGPILVGYEQFADYVRWVHDCLGHFLCEFLDIVEDGNTVTAKMYFHGVHKKTFFGVPPTNQEIWWYGAPIFKFRDGKVCDLWVLGDVYGVVQRMQNARDPIEFSTSH